MEELRYKCWLTDNRLVKVGRAMMLELVAAQRVMTIKEIGQKQPIRNPPHAPQMWEIRPVDNEASVISIAKPR